MLCCPAFSTDRYLSSVPSMFLHQHLKERLVAKSKGEEEQGNNAFLLSFFSLFKLLDRHRRYLSKEEDMSDPAHTETPHPFFKPKMMMHLIRGYMNYLKENEKSKA